MCCQSLQTQHCTISSDSPFASSDLQSIHEVCCLADFSQAEFDIVGAWCLFLSICQLWQKNRGWQFCKIYLISSVLWITGKMKKLARFQMTVCLHVALPVPTGQVGAIFNKFQSSCTFL